MPESEFSRILLVWYDANARVMPWRVGPDQRAVGVRPDPYHVWLSEVMLQQTTVITVHGYFQRFLGRWPTVHQLAAAADSDVMGEWAGLGYYARARNLLKCARVVSRELGGKFPDNQEALIRLPGIGPYTAAAIAAIAFNQPATVVDGNVERVMARYFSVLNPLPAAKPELVDHASRLTPTIRPGDYAQAVMDLGATVCTPKSPRCGNCPCREACAARAINIQNELPRRQPRPLKPTRQGIAYLARRADGAWLLERRPNKGLLGGMLGWPGPVWAKPGETIAEDAPPMDTQWTEPKAEIRHTFTHFHLRLSMRVANVPLSANARIGQFLTPDDFRPSDLPTVMRKAYDFANKELAKN